MTQTFELDGEYIELNKLLKTCGICDTGGAAGIAIEQGAVYVDGTVETRKRCKIRTGQSVRCGNEIITVS